MSVDKTVVALAGSARPESSTKIVLQHVGDGVRNAGGTYDLLELGDYELPPLNPDANRPPDADRLTTAVAEADAIALGTPMYHGSYSGVLKNAIDYCGFDEFENKTVGLVAVSGGAFPTPALNHLRTVCRAVNAWVIPHQVAVPHSHEVIKDGVLHDDDLINRSETLGQNLVAYADIEPTTSTFTADQNRGASN